MNRSDYTMDSLLINARDQSFRDGYADGKKDGITQARSEIIVCGIALALIACVVSLAIYIAVRT